MRRLWRRSVVLTAAALCMFAGRADPGESGKAQRNMPVWQVGDWWVISVDWLYPAPFAEDGKPQLVTPDDLDTLILHPVSFDMRFEVREPRVVGGDLCDVIAISVQKSPADIKNDSKGEALWQLYVRKSDGTCAGCSKRLREASGWRLAGEVTEESAVELERHQPVLIWQWSLVPKEMPLIVMPLDSMKPLHKRDRILSYKDEWVRQAVNQTTEIYEDVVLGKKQRVMMITFWGDGVVQRSQMWISGYPWWVEWKAWPEKGTLPAGPLRAKMIRYGSKKTGLDVEVGVSKVGAADKGDLEVHNKGLKEHDTSVIVAEKAMMAEPEADDKNDGKAAKTGEGADELGQ